MNILVTGGAGFIGSNLIQRLLRTTTGTTVINIDSMTDYNPIKLKVWRLEKNEEASQESGNKYVFIKGDISDKATIDNLFTTYHPNIVVNLAAQAGVRYSIDHPDVYIASNLIGFYNILEACRHEEKLEHLVVCKINNYTDISHYVILNTPKFTEVFRDGKINTISAFRRRS